LAVRAIVSVATVAWSLSEVLRYGPVSARWARAAGTVALLLTLLHVLVAFDRVYGWDHEAAIAATVQQSAETFGWGWRGAIYINYLFLAFWLADVLWWWIAQMSHAVRPRWLEATRFSIFMFMFVNGAVIFASGIGRVIGVVAVSAPLAFRMRAARQSPQRSFHHGTGRSR
jgi:hypothetical protein